MTIGISLDEDERFTKVSKVKSRPKSIKLNDTFFFVSGAVRSDDDLNRSIDISILRSVFSDESFN
jgi:hypothetical protein